MQTLPPLFHRGSVKDIRGQKGDKEYIFEFSDRYSVFDWGEMPDQLNQKGVALANMAQIFFDHLGKKETWRNLKLTTAEKESLKGSDALDLLKEHGLFHHSLGLRNQAGKKIEIGESTRFLAVKAVNVMKPQELDGPNSHGDLYDYSEYQKKPVDCLVPLEVIFRFGTPAGSSLLRRLKKNPHYLEVLGLKRMPQEGDLFSAPLIEFSTKLESEDRYLDFDEAKRIACLSTKEFHLLYDLTLLIAIELYHTFSDLSLELWDGKLEFSFLSHPQDDETRFFQLVDSIGPDELRLLSASGQLSKEYLRQFYQGSEWHNAIQMAKETARNLGETDWKKICREELLQAPRPLDLHTKEVGERIYQALANALSMRWYQQKIFPDALALDQVVAKMEG